jgi:hypothetical protein
MAANPMIDNGRQYPVHEHTKMHQKLGAVQVSSLWLDSRSLSRNFIQLWDKTVLDLGWHHE